MSVIKLQGSDNEAPIEVSLEVARCSATISDMLGLTEDNDPDTIVPLANVTTPVLKKVIEWATYHKDDPPPLEEEDEYKERRSDDITNWDLEFLKVDNELLFNLVLAANYLDIKGLLDLTCKAIANMLKGKAVEEIRKIFKIENDMTEEQMKQIRRENEWLEEK